MANGLKLPSGKMALGVFFLFGFTCLGAEISSASSNKLVKPSAKLDTTVIRKWYLEGEFKKVADSLEAFRQVGSPGVHSDSVFTYRHLGIVYASNEETKIRAESYLNLLLKLEPETDILDPFVSASVDAFWESIRTRHNKVAGNKPRPKVDANHDPIPMPSGHQTQFEDERGFPWVWAIVGTAVVGGAVGFYLWDQSQSEPQKMAEPVLDTVDITLKFSK